MKRISKVTLKKALKINGHKLSAHSFDLFTRHIQSDSSSAMQFYHRKENGEHIFKCSNDIFDSSLAKLMTGIFK